MFIWALCIIHTIPKWKSKMNTELTGGSNDFAAAWVLSCHTYEVVLMTLVCSEALAFSLVTGINIAKAKLVDIWDNIGIMEEQRVERMETVKKHIEVSFICA